MILFYALKDVAVRLESITTLNIKEVIMPNIALKSCIYLFISLPEKFTMEIKMKLSHMYFE